MKIFLLQRGNAGVVKVPRFQPMNFSAVAPYLSSNSLVHGFGLGRIAKICIIPTLDILSLKMFRVIVDRRILGCQKYPRHMTENETHILWFAEELTFFFSYYLKMLLSSILPTLLLSAVASAKYIVPGARWRDTAGNLVNAHAGGVTFVPETGKFWWFGEYKIQGQVEGGGVSVYSSDDLATWTPHGLALSMSNPLLK